MNINEAYVDLVCTHFNIILVHFLILLLVSGTILERSRMFLLP
jgi:hypothetical protein